MILNTLKTQTLSKKNTDNILFFGLVLVFIVSPLPLGSNREWAYFGISAFVFLLLAIYSVKTFFIYLKADQKITKKDFDYECLLILIASVWLFMQSLIKIPIDWLKFVSPTAFSHYTLAFNVLSIKSSEQWVTISLDRTETFNNAILTLSCFGVVYLMGKLINTSKRLKIFCYAIVFSGCFQAIYGVMMTVTGVEYLFFVPKDTYFGNATGTFVNRNHLGGYLEMTLSLGIGLLLMLRSSSESHATQWHLRRVLRKIVSTMLSEVAIVRCMLIIMVVGLIMTHSRMANVAFFNSFLITSAIALTVNRNFRSTGFYIILTSIVTFDLLILGSVFDLNKVVNRLENTGLDTEDRDEIAAFAFNMIPDYWLTGSGAGTFVYAFPAYIKKNFNSVFDFAHNDFLQIFIEFGMLGMIPLAFYVLLSFLRSIKLIYNGDDNLQRGIGFATTMGCISLMIHSTVDFNLQIPANILLFISLIRLSKCAKQIRQIKKLTN